MIDQSCPLCCNPTTQFFYQDAYRAYHRCPNCALIFLARADLLPPSDEKSRYDLHENSPNDPGYRKFLRKLADPLLARLGPTPQHGLDFGSGPGPTLSIILQEHGHKMALYDPYFAPHPQVLETKYDFVTCTETIEHFYTPKVEWQMLVDLLKPGGWLGIMTKLIEDLDQFPHLHYIKDRTHVSFFSRSTFRFLARRDHLSVEFIGDNVVLLQKERTGGVSREDND